MRYIIIISATFLATAVQAFCFVDYKAKQDDPLKLHYGVMELMDQQCSFEEAQKVVTQRLLLQGWTLLNLLSVSASNPTLQQKANAGENFLRY